MLVKPKEQTHKYYNLEEIVFYLEKEHKVTFDIYNWFYETVKPREDSGLGRLIWHLNIDSTLKYYEEADEVKEALAIIKKEFCEEDATLSFYANWG